MGKRGYGAMSLVRVGFDPDYVRTFGKREARRFVCNRCSNRFKPGERGRQTTFGAYRHLQCPSVSMDLPSGWSSKWGGR